MENGRWLELRKFILDGMVLCERQQCEPEKSVLNRPVQRLHRLDIESATPQVIPAHGGAKPETNCVTGKNVPICKPKRNFDLSKRGQGGKDVTALHTRTGRLSKKPNIRCVTRTRQKQPVFFHTQLSKIFENIHHVCGYEQIVIVVKVLIRTGKFLSLV